MDNQEPVKRVVGLQYQPEQGVPRVVLKGIGRSADDVLVEASKLTNDVPVVQDKALLDRLFRLPVDAPIDAELFELVAILLVHVYAVDARQLQTTGLIGSDGKTVNRKE